MDYDSMRRSFGWDAQWKELLGARPGQVPVNLATLAVDRHAAGPLARKTAIRWLGKDGSVREFSYSDLSGLSNRFAHALARLGVRKGERVFALLGRMPELYISALGTLKNQSVFCPLFSAFGPDPIRLRMELGGAKALVTTDALYRRKVAPIRDALPRLEHVLIVDRPEYRELMEGAPGQLVRVDTSAEDWALIHFTSGTTGRPKGAIHVHGAAVAHYATGKLALDLRGPDAFWCTADPGWVTGTSYGIFSPLLNGVTSIVDEADFDAERWYRILEAHRVTVWYTAPTAIRMLMKAGAELPRRFDLGALRFMGSVGEPLNPEAVIWGKETLGLPFHDNWWQTETGGIMIANFPGLEIRPGSMGKPLPGIEAAIVQREPQGSVRVVEKPDQVGEIALRAGWPSMFRGYLGEEERYRKCFAGEWYLTGDLARRDPDGYFWFVGRSDDVIKSSGHLIGPFEVESALMEHPAVAEAAVIGKPDPVALETVKAFVSLKRGFEPGEELQREILGFGRKRLGIAVAPKEVAILPGLPKTRSGKIMRRLLKARELGLPEGDTSTLEAAT